MEIVGQSAKKFCAITLSHKVKKLFPGKTLNENCSG